MKWHDRAAGLLFFFVVAGGCLWLQHQGKWLSAIALLLFGIFAQLTRIIETLRGGFVSEPVQKETTK